MTEDHGKLPGVGASGEEGLPPEFRAKPAVKRIVERKSL